MAAQAAPSAAPSLLPGQSPPLLVITGDDDGGVILIVTALALVCALVSLLIRAYVRSGFSTARIAWDDAFILAAMVFSIAQSAAVFVEVNDGLGKTSDQLSAQQSLQIEKGEYADDILYVIAVWLSKVSVAVLFLRLSPNPGHVMASRIDAIVVAVTAVVAVMILALRCNIDQPWISTDSQGQICAGLFERWQVVAAFDISLEVLLFATAVYLLYNLQLPVGKIAAIVFAFALRFLVIIPAAVRLHFLSLGLESSSFSANLTYAIICKQVEISWAIVGATLPCLRPFMKATATNYGAADNHSSKHRSYGGHQSRSRSSEKTVGWSLASLTSKAGPSKRHDGFSQMNGDYAGPAPSTGNQKTNISSTTGPSRDAQSIESSESKQMIIRKDVEYTVDFNNISGTTGVDDGEVEPKTDDIGVAKS